MAKKPDIKQKQYCNKFNIDFKNGPHPKKKKKRERESEVEKQSGREAQEKECRRRD